MGAMGPNKGPVRIKKKPNIFQSIIGVFVGIILVLGSPYAMWLGGSQDKAGEFESAERVEAVAGVEGYVVIEGVPEYAEASGGDECYLADCIYQEESMQTLVTEQKLVCGDVKQDEDTRILFQDGYEYDEDTGETVPCYQVEQDSWEEDSLDVLAYEVMVGELTVVPSGDAVMLDSEEDIVNDEFDENGKAIHRSVYTSFVMPSELLVAGVSDGSEVVAPVKDVFVLSSYGDATTLSMLEDIDAQNALMYRIVAFLMLFIGFSLMFGPLEWAARMFGKIPGLGMAISKGSRFLITLMAAVLAAIFWIVIWLIVTLIQIWWLGLIVLAVIGLIIWLVSKKK